MATTTNAGGAPRPPVPLSVLDLAPVRSGGTVGDALRETIDLARRAEEFGYHRYWLAEHHFAAGVASSAPAVLIALVAAATGRIRVGSGAVQLGHQTPATVVEQFGTIDALYPGRIDLGLGRSGQKHAEVLSADAAPPAASPAPPAPEPPRRSVPDGKGGHLVDGLLIPPSYSFATLARLPRFRLYASLLQQPGAETPDFAAQVDEILALLDGTYVSADGIDAHAVPGEGAELAVWVLGSSGGQSARVAGERGLPFAANYHVSPSSVLEAVDAYRAAFKPSATLAAPYVLVSADVLVTPDDETARAVGAPFGHWVRSIRTGRGAMPYPSPEEAAADPLSEEDRLLVADRLDTRFAGPPETVVERLRVLRDVTGADELLVTTIAHDHADRVRSFRLLAEAWGLD
ncbi:putative monooxygenase (luciferase-like) [Sphaerisporangium krabiense]|uniref:LLM class flavin-dependent oxidoreductase n=1 Tax=Sphaerisporangium krabiense TaxID=763782 RepID=UPI00194E0EB4|nr:LLM class flavin-dependent oxidoreductase [Sphaerisporangium krabiense]GII60689.1 putative monooxygenase (luciferase-like) [Sphaerisporangium krabiense]